MGERIDEGNAEKEEAMNLPEPVGPIVDFGWLEAPEGAKIEAGQKLADEKSRARQMQEGTSHMRKRMWHCDGDYVFFRRRMASTPMPGAPDGLNPHLVQRHNKMIAAGEYKHVATQDDVEIYELTESSPLKRKGIDLGACNLSQVRWYAIYAVLGKFPGSPTRRDPDYGLFCDCLEEMSSRIKAMYHDAQAKQVYNEELAYTFHLINQAGGPSQGMIDFGVQAIRKKRGQGTGKVILLPR